MENCSGLTNEDEDYHWAFDVDCKQKRPTVCQDIQVYFRMRGLCTDSVMDKLFRLVTIGTGRRMFYGPSGWKLSWENDEKFWTITNERYPGSCSLILIRENMFYSIGVSANVTVSKYPLGSNKWRVSGGDGCSSEPYETSLTLSYCNNNQFTCDDGLCVDMRTR